MRFRPHLFEAPFILSNCSKPVKTEQIGSIFPSVFTHPFNLSFRRIFTPKISRKKHLPKLVKIEVFTIKKRIFAGILNNRNERRKRKKRIELFSE